MHPRYASYLLESEWSWDHTNTEFASIVIEGVDGERWEPELETMLSPNCPLEQKKAMLHRLLSLAGLQNSCQMSDKPRLVRLWRLKDLTGNIPRGYRPNHCEMGKRYNLNMELELVCEFDNDNNPVLPPK